MKPRIHPAAERVLGEPVDDVILLARWPRAMAWRPVVAMGCTVAALVLADIGGVDLALLGRG